MTEEYYLLPIDNWTSPWVEPLLFLALHMYSPSSSALTSPTLYWFPVPGRFVPFLCQVMVAGGLDSGLHSNTAVCPLRIYTSLGGTWKRGATRLERQRKDEGKNDINTMAFNMSNMSTSHLRKSLKENTADWLKTVFLIKNSKETQN